MSPAEQKRKAARRSVRHTRPQSADQIADQAPQTADRAVDRSGEPTVEHRPMIVRTTEAQMTGVRSFIATRYVIGYVMSGYKLIYTGDMSCQLTPGEIFFLSKGTHYIEEAPEDRKPFEQIMFCYTSEQIGRVIAELGVVYNIDTCIHHTCEECMLRDYVASPGWEALRHFFTATGKNLRAGFYADNPTAELLALTSLVYQIISRPEGCLRTRILSSTDPEKELMERQLRDYIFSDMTLEQFAQRTNRSLSSFKKKFKEYYGEPPHRWVVRQRLTFARLQVISTDRDIAQIARDCRFPNASYFIRLFRTEFDYTPTQYRAKYGGSIIKPPKPTPEED